MKKSNIMMNMMEMCMCSMCMVSRAQIQQLSSHGFPNNN